VSLSQNAFGYDSNLANQYLLGTGGNGVDPEATATVNNGVVEASNLVVTVAATNGFAPAATVYLATTQNCVIGSVIGTATTTIGATNSAGPVTLTVPTASLNTALGTTGTNPVYICYSVGAVSTAIPNSAFSSTVTLVKAAAGANLNEQNNECQGPDYSLGGGIKIDVRNYANSKDPNGWYSVIRLINNSDARAVDVWGQIIQPNGAFGPYGLLTQGQNPGTPNANKLPARGVLNLTAAQIDGPNGLLNLAPNSVENGASTAQSSATGARLRITSQAASTLRVQNYLYNPASQNFIEVSGGEGVDFDQSITRAPLNEGQYQYQDAESGLNGQ
jgi:hypothetical protein